MFMFHFNSVIVLFGFVKKKKEKKEVVMKTINTVFSITDLLITEN